MTPDSIFIQIAAYRDAELLPTLRDCVAKATQPERLSFGICWQRTDDESLAEFASDARVRVIELPAERSRGACWARQQTQGLYRGEAYTLQLDSHHRFAAGWDVLLVQMLVDLQAKGHAKPLLTSYVPVYDPQDDPVKRSDKPLRLHFDGFTPDGPFAVMPHTMDNFLSLSAPEPARFFSGHFAFTVGAFCHEVPYDPQLYFFGEEQSMAMRAYTQGYDLFHPHRTVVWHHYGREKSPKHWGDHWRWHLRNALSMQRFRQLVDEGQQGIAGAQSALGSHGLGTRRTLKDYENHTGISFEWRGATAHAMKGLPPPDPAGPPGDAEAWRARLLLPKEVAVQIRHDVVPGPAEQYEFVFVGAHSSRGEELVRHDLRGQDLAQAMQDGGYTLRFLAASEPASWTVWPYLCDGGWGHKTTRSLG